MLRGDCGGLEWLMSSGQPGSRLHHCSVHSASWRPVVMAPGVIDRACCCCSWPRLAFWQRSHYPLNLLSTAPQLSAWPARSFATASGHDRLLLALHMCISAPSRREWHCCVAFDVAVHVCAPPASCCSLRSMILLLCCAFSCPRCCLADGQTGSGKSWSMQGRNEPPELRGITPNSFEHIFEFIKAAEGECVPAGHPAAGSVTAGAAVASGAGDAQAHASGRCVPCLRFRGAVAYCMGC